MASSSEQYPVPGYYFNVYIGGTEFAFKEVSGIKATMEYKEEPRQGGDTSNQHKVFDKFSFNNISFKKGLVKGGALALKLFKDKFQIEFDKNPSSVSIQYQDVIITLMNEKGENAMVIALQGAYPISWEVSVFDAMSKELVIESMELNYQKLKIS